MKTTKFTPDLPKTTGRLINQLSNMILHMAYVEHSRKSEELGVLRCIYTKPSEIRDAGDQTGRLPDEIKFRSEEKAVQKILSCFEEPKRAIKKTKKTKKSKKKKKAKRKLK